MTDDVSDDEIRRIAAKLGAPGPRAVAKRLADSVRYEAIMADGGQKWHVMRICGEERKYVGTKPSQASASQMIKRLMEDEGEAQA